MATPLKFEPLSEITSFGVRPAPVTSLQGGDGDGGLTLTDLPLELVQLVFTYLDSWSLANLALKSILIANRAAR